MIGTAGVAHEILLDDEQAVQPCDSTCVGPERKEERDDDDEGGGGETRYLAVGHTLPVRGVALDRSARYFCSCSDDERVLIWDLSGRLLAELRGHVDAV